MDLKSIPILSVVVMLLMDMVAGRDRGQHADIGKWTKWTDWSACSLSCGSGIVTRTRIWQQPPGEKKFEHPFTMSENQGCNQARCPVDGSWGMWGHWLHCTEACGGGITRRERRCRPPANGGKDCDGEDFEEDDCNRLPCPPPPARFNMSICTKKKHFMCASHRMCIRIAELCDNTVQCDDGSDEKRCYDMDKMGSVKYSYVKDTGSTNPVSLSAIAGLVVMVIVIRVIG